MSGRDGLRIDVLGPLRVSVDGVPLELGGPLPRRLLAVLVAAAGRPVSDDLLTDLVWDGDAPARAIASVQAYVSGLRKVVGGREVLERSSAGYRLVLPPGTTDVDRFDAAVDRGRAHLAEGRAADAVVALEDALATWRGEPFAELEGSTWVRSDVSRLRELRTVAVEERLAARLASGDAVGAATELEGAVDDEPYRERRWSLLALALYRSGRQADALEALRRVRDLLAEELGVDPGEQLRALEGAVLTQDPVLLHAATVAVAPFSPAAADAAAPAKPQLGPRRVPRALSSFVGRAQERAELTTALATHRVVTLVGPAGAGKTRLAIEHAGALAEQDGPWFVGLADVQDGAVVPVAVAEALGVAGAGEDPIASIVRALQGRSGLLVVDNCEHVIDAAATTVERLASAVPGLVVLATSREPLAVDGEAVLDVGSLAVDDEVGGDGPAIALFVDRVRQVRPGWSPDPKEKDAVRSVCSALDGIPLALELAAARSRVLSLGELATSLGDRFAVLPRVPRSSTSAHATLEAAIAWSFDLLGPAERDLVLRLWPFEGGFSLAAAESVTPHAHDVLNTLSSLVTRSVVRADTSVSPTRYSMLETIRAYSRGQSEDQDGDRAAQAAWIEQLVATVTGGLRGSRAGRLMRDLEREMPNVRAAFAYLMEVDPVRALAVAGDLGWFFYRRGHVTEGRRWLVDALEAAPEAPNLLRARALGAWARLDYLDGRLDREQPPIEQALALIDETAGAEYALALCHSAYFLLRADDGASARTRALVAREAAVAAGEGAAWVVAEADMVLGAALASLGDPVEGHRVLMQSVDEALAVDHRWGAASSLWLAALLQLGAGEATAAHEGLCRCVGLLHSEADVSSTLIGFLSGAGVLAALGRGVDAATLLAGFDIQAARSGYSPRDMDPRTTAVVEGLVASVTTPQQRLDAAQQAEAMSWEDLLDLLGVPYVD